MPPELLELEELELDELDELELDELEPGQLVPLGAASDVPVTSVFFRAFCSNHCICCCTVLPLGVTVIAPKAYTVKE